MHRVLDHYLHTAMAATQRFSPYRSPLRLAAPQPGVLPAELADKEQAMAWFDAEAPVLLALIELRQRQRLRHLRLADPLDARPVLPPARPVAGVRGQPAAPRWPPRGGWATPLALAHAHHLLGHAQLQLGDYAAAEPNLRRALDLFRELEDRANEAVVLNGLGGMLEKQERYPEALAVALDALRMLKAAGHWWTQATLENGVGWLYAHLGQYDEALSHCQRALSLHRESGHRGGAADTLDSLGFIYLHLGDLDQAQAYYQQAIDAYREIGAPFGEGNSLAGLGDVLLRGATRTRPGPCTCRPPPSWTPCRTRSPTTSAASSPTWTRTRIPGPSGVQDSHHGPFGIKERARGSAWAPPTGPGGVRALDDD